MAVGASTIPGAAMESSTGEPGRDVRQNQLKEMPENERRGKVVFSIALGSLSILQADRMEREESTSRVMRMRAAVATA